VLILVLGVVEFSRLLDLHVVTKLARKART
jgi:hypothetical protein